MNAWRISDKQEYSGQVGSVLEGPNGQEFWLTEPEDRSWYRDLKEVVVKLNELELKVSNVTTERDVANQEIERLKEDLDRMTKGTWSKEIARQSVINSQLRAKVEKLRGELERALRDDHHCSALEYHDWWEIEKAKVKKLEKAISDYLTADTQANWKQREALEQALADTEEK